MANYTLPWIKLWRSSEKNEFYFSDPFDKWHAWQDLLIMADDSGTVKTSLRRLKTRWNWSSVRQIVKHLETLSETGQITISGTPSGTVITIVNWEKYQRKKTKNGTQKSRKNSKSGTVFGTEEVNNRSREPYLGPVPTVQDKSYEELMKEIGDDW